MNYLLCIDSYGRHKYYELKENQEEHITKLIREYRIPKHFQLNGKEVISSEIIGFTNEKKEDKPDLGIRSMDDLRNWAKQQKWYKKKVPKDIAIKPETKPVTLLP